MTEIIFTIKTRIEGNFVLKEPIKIRYGLYEIEMRRENGKYMVSVSKEMSIEKADLIELIRNCNKSEFKCVFDKYLDNKMLDVFRHMEAYGGFQHGITKIYYYEYLVFLWIDKTESRVISQLEKSLKSHKKVLITNDNLSKLLHDKALIPKAEIPYNFFREANSYMLKFDYVSAYIHFYMILEYCFAEGQFSKEQIKRFKSSIMLKLAVLSALNMAKEHHNDLYQEINQECTSIGKKLNFDSIVEVLYKYRGALSHAPQRAKYEKEPISVKPITILISTICLMVCGHMKVYCDKFVPNATKVNRVKKHIQELEQELNLE